MSAAADNNCLPNAERPQRLVLLGASNVTRAFATVVRTALDLWHGTLDVLAAIGHGRSYALPRSIFWHELPGILECGLWQALGQRSPVPTVALVTDIGNDLLYDAAVETIAGWVDTGLERLQQAGARIVLTALPLCSITRLSPTRFMLLRTLVFPGCRLKYDTVMQRAHELDRRIRELAKARQVVLAEPQSQWYRFDPIHLRRGCWPVAWRELLTLAAPPATGPRATRLHVRIRQPRAEHSRIFGRERTTPQPGRVLSDGTTLSMY